jgi:arylsulfatase A-like enzyme
MRLEDVAPPARPGAAHPDVVLVTHDTVRGDLTPPLGGAAEMPNLAGLAGEGAVFEWAFSPGNVTRRSLPSLATGRSPPRVLGRVAGWALKLDPRHVLLAERFAAAGYDTAGFFCCDSHFGARHALGLERGFEHVEIAYGAGELAARLARFLAARRSDRPLYVWMHFIEPHNWEKDHPATAEARSARQRYMLALAEVDRHLGAVLAAAWAPARRARTVLAVTADHGESLGDHRSRTHAKTLFNSEVRVPLVIAGPGIAPRRIRRPVGLVDLAPTLLDLAGFVPPGMPEMDGVSLAPVLAGERAGIDDGAAYVVQMPDRSVKNGLRAVVVGRFKLIVDGEDRPVGLYDYVADRAETRDLAAANPDVVARLQAELRRRTTIDRVAPTRR